MNNLIRRQDAIDAIKDADVCVAYNAFDIDIDEAIELAIRATKVSVIASIETLSSAQLEKKIFEKMPDAEFEKWLYEHGISHPDIYDSISCEAVPLLIDSAISELSSAQPEQKKGKWIKKKSMIYCPNCYNGFEAIFIRDYNFCPNCGAKMEG